MKKTLPALILALLLTACANSPTALLSPDSLYPAAITACRDEPVVPGRPATGVPRTDQDKANYTRDLHGAWADCHDTVAATAERRRLYAEQYKRATESPARRFFRFGR
ncbi:MAG: hypothetical protein ACK4MI_03900 [Brevundimonas sp.]|uniref:hypothetical protein n=1 Tax=Brevundimonas sp. TaxID=1871086 RepID=UPI00391DDB8E